MSLFKCKMCGGDLEIAEGVTIAECEYCGTKQTVPKAMDENLQNLFNRANTLRIKSEFDKAEKLYEKIIQADTTQSEAYWGLILCKYGIEYVDDPATFKKIPTCHRASYDSIIADDDYKSALENADISQRAIYEEQAKEIDRIQKEILALAQKEETYDVFICYKETDADGHRTQDSVIANDIYYQLTQEGFKVFYAAITLEGKLGSAYEPIIFAALNSAKVMLSIGTKPEYFNSVWVKNEWSRFLKIIQKDRSKLLIPCYRDMDAYELPEEFAHLQAQDMAKIGFINDLVRGIKKVVKKDEPKQGTVVKETVVTTTNATVAPLLKRAFMFLEDGDWTSADEYCEKVLDQDPECAQAYLGKLMVELHVKKQDGLKDQTEPFDDNNNYQKAIRFAGSKLRDELIGYIEHINTRNENARLEGRYNQAISAMRSAKSEDEYKEAAEIFKSIRTYKDSDGLINKCLENAEIARKDAILLYAKQKAGENSIASCEEAIKWLSYISGWRDVDEQVVAYQKKIEELKAKAEADRLEKVRLAEIARIEEEKIAKRKRKIAIITTPIVCAIFAFIIVLNAVIIPNGKYDDAILLMDAGKYSEAISVFEALDGYKDSVNRINECNNAILDGKYNDAIALMEVGKLDEAYVIFQELGDYKDSTDKLENIRVPKNKESLKNAKVGDYIKFGMYEQDNNISNGKEEIEWLMLDIKDGKALVISKYALDCIRYNTSHTDVTWETCTLRKWLNNDFLNSAFSAEESEIISTATVSADKNPLYITNSGKTTQDKVFLLSITEVNQYFSSAIAIQCEPTDYVVFNRVYRVYYRLYMDSNNGNCLWWLRSPGESQTSAAVVLNSGNLGEYGYAADNGGIAVRPAMWIDIS